MVVRRGKQTRIDSSIPTNGLEDAANMRVAVVTFGAASRNSALPLPPNFSTQRESKKMTQAITKYEANDGKVFDTLMEAETHDLMLELGEQAEAFVKTLNLSKGNKILVERILKWEQYKSAPQADNVVDMEEAREA